MTWKPQAWYRHGDYEYEVIDVRHGWAAAWVWKAGKLITVTALAPQLVFDELRPGQALGNVLDLW